MNVTPRQLVTLLLLTLTFAVFLALLPEHPATTAHKQSVTALVSQAAK